MARSNKVFLTHCYLLYEIAAYDQPELPRHVLLRRDFEQLEDGATAAIQTQLHLPESTEFKLIAKADEIIGQALLEAHSLDPLTVCTMSDGRDEPWRIIGTAESADWFRGQAQTVFQTPQQVETYSVILVIEAASATAPPEPSAPYPTIGQAVGLMLLFWLVQILTYLPVVVLDTIAHTKWMEHAIPLALSISNSAYWVLRFGLRRSGRTWSDLWPRKTVVGYTFPAQLACGSG